MPPRANRRTALAAVAAFLTASPALAQPDEAARIRGVIDAQFRAFAEDDADAAFETATPAVRRAMGHPLRFLAMVRGTYPMVYGAKSIRFLDHTLEQRSAWQLVGLVDPDGRAWVALFALQRQPDGTWRIAGCSVSEARGQPA